jgi:hypothetical protein
MVSMFFVSFLLGCLLLSCSLSFQLVVALCWKKSMRTLMMRPSVFAYRDYDGIPVVDDKPLSHE